MIGPTGRVAYAVSQTARVSWFFAQYALAARIGGSAVPSRRRPTDLPIPDTRDVLEEIRRLLKRDLANIEAGYYRLPHDMVVPPGRTLAAALRFFGDLPEVHRRRRTGARVEIRRSLPPSASGLPPYYLQNFHFQTDGYLSDRSARLYDHQVEVLFGGGADAMRRQALVPIWRLLGKQGVKGRRLADIGAGTGRFLTFVKDNYPRLDVTALDLSRNYLAEARRNLAPWRGVRFVQAAAEAMPFANASQDIVTCIYLFHELPSRVRQVAAAEMARVLKPGGVLVFADSIQPGDSPHLDGLLALFPLGFHEPYFANYLRQDLGPIFARAGLEPAGIDLAFMTKVLTFRKRR